MLAFPPFCVRQIQEKVICFKAPWPCEQFGPSGSDGAQAGVAALGSGSGGVPREAPLIRAVFHKPGKERLLGSGVTAPHAGRDRASGHVATPGPGAARVTRGHPIKLEGTDLTVQQRSQSPLAQCLAIALIVEMHSGSGLQGTGHLAVSGPLLQPQSSITGISGARGASNNHRRVT